MEIKNKDFIYFCEKQSNLVDILNHRMTSVEKNLSSISVDVSWTKKILWAIFATGLASILMILIKSIFGV